MRALFINAPFGPLFRELAQALESEGVRVLRTVLDGGDWMETPRRNRVHIDPSRPFPEFVRDLMQAERIGLLVTYNDTRPRSQAALAAARALGIPRLVMENGYLRPHHVTLSRDGVNANSGLSRDPAVALRAGTPPKPFRTFPVRMRPHVLNTIRHFVWSTLLKPAVPYDPAYYGDPVGRQALGYMREYAYRLSHDETAAFARIERLRGRGAVALVLMQKPGDSQIRHHSRFAGNVPFLEEVLRSFAAHAPPDTMLAVKQHPLDYGIERLPQAFAGLSRELGLTGRAIYLRRVGIDRVMDAAERIVTINSTGGLQGVMRGLPVKCLGQAVYDVPGLTFQGDLDAFWRDGLSPEPEAVAAYHAYLTAHCQINGGFHTREARRILIPALVRRIVEAGAGYGIGPKIGIDVRKA